MRRRLLVLLPLLALPLLGDEVAPPRKPLTLEAATGMPPLVTPGVTGVAWRDARRFTYLVREGEGEKGVPALWEWDVASGKKTKLLDPLPVPMKAEAPPKDEKDKEKEKAPKTLPFAGAQWNRAGTALLLDGESDLWVWDAGSKTLSRLTDDAEDEEYPTFSPDGSKVAFVKKNDLWVVEVATKAARRLTSDGAELIHNGKLDWVYEEELANRRSGRSYEWAPDGNAIVFLRLDDRHVPEVPIVDFLPAHAKANGQRYPKPGDPNPIPSVHLVPLDGGAEQAVRFDPDDVLVSPEFSFTADGTRACYLVLDRVQTRIEVRLLGRDGTKKTLFTESDPAWVNAIEPPHFLPDGSFLFLSERSGFLHLYRFAADGTLKNAVTKGEWQVDRAPEVDEAGGWVWFVATEKDPRERHVYRARLDGTGFARMTEGKGTHGVSLAPGGGHWLDTYNDVSTPPRTTLRRADGKEVALVAESKSRAGEWALGAVELGSFRGKDGTLFYTKLVKPADFDPRKKYPVVVDVYGGPHVQTVRDSFMTVSAFDHYLATQGFLVFGMDNRGSWGRGHAFEAPLLRKTGAVELADQLEGVAWLKGQPFVDPARVGIWGWSYGGYLTLYAATHAGATFKCAVAGAPVVDWKYYDSIYTERYMKLPKENEAGYQASAPLAAAKDLGTKLLILHGTSDDNVHLQNSIAFTDALIRARKDFDFVPLAGQKHGPRDPAMRLYVNKRVAEFFKANL